MRSIFSKVDDFMYLIYRIQYTKVKLAIDLLGRGGPGVLPWRGLGNPAWGAGNPQSFPSFPKRFVENALDIITGTDCRCRRKGGKKIQYYGPFKTQLLVTLSHSSCTS